MTRDDFKDLKIGDTVYKVSDVGIIPSIIKSIDNSSYYWKIFLEDGRRVEVSPKSNNKTYYLTKEEAEKYIEVTEKEKIKKKKLYEYEQKLNKELSIETFLIKY